MKKRPTINECELIDLPVRADAKRGGSLVPFQTDRLTSKNVTIRQVYAIYSGKPHHPRGQHYHKTLQEIFFVVSGGVDIFVDDGKHSKTFKLSAKKPQALYIPPRGCWHELRNWKPNTIVIGMASTFYRPSEFIAKRPV